MNYFAHALPFLDNPYYLAGTGVPDWLTVVDRKVRVRMKHALSHTASGDATMVAIAGGIAQHLRDDARFHETRAFAELSLDLSCRARDATPDDSGLRPFFLGHLLVEVLLDATLIADAPERLETYYRVLDEVDPALVENAVNQMAQRPTDRLAWMIAEFSRHRILWDYLEDAKLMTRLNQVMRRVGLEPLPADFQRVIAEARPLVRRRAGELLAGIPVPRPTE